MSDCAHCDHLQRQVRELEKRAARLERRLHHLRRRLEWARQVCLRSTAAVPVWWLHQARSVLSSRGGVPRGTWAFCRGMEQVSTSLLFILVVEE